MITVHLIIDSQHEEHSQDELSQREVWAKNQKTQAIWMKLDHWRHLPDDFAISRYLIKKGSEPAYLPRGNISNTEVIRNHMYYRLKSSENAEMASLGMKKLHEILECKISISKFRYYFEFYKQKLRNFHRNFKNPVRYCRSLYSICSTLYRARINRQ